MPKARLPQGFYWRGGRIWCVTDPIKQRRTSTGCTDIQAALMWHARRQRAAADPAHAAAEEATLGDWITRTLKHKERQRSAGTLSMYKVKAGHLARILGEARRMATVSSPIVDMYVETRESEGAAQPTIGKELTVLVQICKLARRAGQYAGDIAALRPVGYSSVSRPRKRVLTALELQQLSRRMQPEHFAGVAFIVATSARDSEMRHARIEDYDPETRVIRLRGTKTKVAAREVPVLEMFGDVWEAALAWLQEHGGFEETTIAHALTYWTAKLGMDHASPNDLRRTCASRLVAHRVPFDVAGKVLGHASVNMLYRVYGQLTGEQLRELIEPCAGSVQTAWTDADATDDKPALKPHVSSDDEDLKSSAGRRPGSSPGGATNEQESSGSGDGEEPPEPGAPWGACDDSVTDPGAGGISYPWSGVVHTAPLTRHQSDAGRIDAQAPPPAPSTVCWHCGDCLLTDAHPHCDRCPDFAVGCDEYGCEDCEARGAEPYPECLIDSRPPPRADQLGDVLPPEGGRLAKSPLEDRARSAAFTQAAHASQQDTPRNKQRRIAQAERGRSPQTGGPPASRDREDPAVQNGGASPDRFDLAAAYARVMARRAA
jgi:integrase